MKKLFLSTALSLSAVLNLAAEQESEPLQRADAYTLELSQDLKPSSSFFPIGVLADRKFEILPFMGLNISEAIHTCYDYPRGKKCSHIANQTDRGLYYYCHWVAHTLYNSRKTKTHGELKTLVRDNGKEAGRHALRIADPKTRQYVLDAARASVESIVRQKRSNVFLWGIDNEWELAPDYSPESVALFHKWLEKNYNGDLKKLNTAWKSNYKAFTEAVPPKSGEYDKRPGAWLDWRSYTEEEFAGFLGQYFAAIRNGDPEKRPVAAKNTQCTLEMQAVAKKRAVNHEKIADATRPYSGGWYGFDQYGHGDRSNYEMNYFYNCIRPLNPEQGRRYGGFSAENNNHSGPGWQFAQTYWRMIANGLRGIDFFVMGNFGARNDYATFGFTDIDGIRRDRFYYLSRFASMIHRSERFWAQAAPSAGAGRLAMLLPQRDIMLAGPTGVSWWDYSANNRLNVYSRLRDAGFWVDVIPYGKLNAEYLARYRGLFLVGAEHLRAKEIQAISDYVKNGGVLFADMRSGNFDEHHIETNGLADILGLRYQGVYTGIEVSPDDLWYNTRYGNVIRADGRILAELTTAKLVNADDVRQNAKSAWITCNSSGRGRAYWFNTRLGALRPESVSMNVITDWFKDRLRDAGIRPAYSSPHAAVMRVETPLADDRGNHAIVIAGTSNHPVPAAKLKIDGLNPDFRHAFWVPAESNLFMPVDFKHNKQTLEFELPEIRTAGVLYLFRDYAPMLGLSIKGTGAHAKNDPHTPEFKPGNSFKVTVQLVNPSGERLPGGTVRLRALSDWNVSGPQEAWSTSAGGVKTYTFRVTTPEASRNYRPNFVYPLVAEFIQEGRRTAVTNAIVSIALDPRTCDSLLSDNPTNEHNARHFVLRTGADYTITTPGIADPRKALNDGRTGRQRLSCKRQDFEAVFDLKKEYSITGLALLRVNARTAPSSGELSVSKDGKTYTAPTAFPIAEWQNGTFRTNLKPETGRYVKIRIIFPEPGGGMLDEIEIFGRKL